MEGAGIQIKGIFQMDAGKRSRHTNAYFTGLGKTKRIVLYDTLIQSHPQEEVLAVLAHEAGHFKKKHILKQFLLIESAMLIFFYLTYLLIDWPFLYQTFGFEMAKDLCRSAADRDFLAEGRFLFNAFFHGLIPAI